MFLPIEQGASIAGKPGSHREHMSLANPAFKPAGQPPQGLLILIYPPHREAEWRFCAVGLPAWMPGEPRWAKDGPWRRAHEAGPERGNLSAAKALHHRVPIHSMRRGTLGFCLHSGAAMGIHVVWIIEWQKQNNQTTKTLVGAGLPAMAALRSSRQNELPASRASPAPTENICRSPILHSNRPASRLRGF